MAHARLFARYVRARLVEALAYTLVVLALHNEKIAVHGGSAGIRDPGLLESALARPLNLAVCEQSPIHRPERLAILLLIVALVTCMCCLIGLRAIARAEHYRLQANRLRHRPVFSVFTIGRLLALSQHQDKCSE